MPEPPPALAKLEGRREAPYHRTNAINTRDFEGMRRNARIRLLAIAAALLLHAPAIASPIVETEDGPVTGHAGNGVMNWLGIPFAAPPLGPERWAMPRPPQKWTDPLRYGAAFGPACPQTRRYGLTEASLAEDCLSLNVSAPLDRREGEKLPVIYWVHGGAFVGGASRLYRLDWLAAKGAVVVSSNFRLGALGYMAHRSFPKETNGALALADQRFAMQWIQRNIARFGGDPGNVTIMGESAGAASICSHLAAPEEVKGLFHKAALQSAGCLFPLQTVEQGYDFGDRVEAKLREIERLAGRNCDPDQRKCLENAPIDSLLKAQEAATLNLKDWAIKVGAPQGAPRSFADALTSGKFMKVPLLFGGTRDEVKLYVGYDEQDCKKGVAAKCTTPETIDGFLAAIYSAPAAARINRAYDVDKKKFAGAPALRGDIMSDYNPLIGINNCLYLHTADTIRRFSPGQPVFQWEFADENAPVLGVGIPATPDPGFHIGAAHSTELNYLFPNFSNTSAIDGPELSPASQKLSGLMLDYWTSFARDGVPKTDRKSEGPAVWPAAANARMVLRLEPGNVGFYNADAAHKCGFWRKLFPKELGPVREER